MRDEYPRPDFVRKEWYSLNGAWDCCLSGEPAGEIQVPFVYQCRQSGIFQATSHENMKYEREVEIPQNWKGKRVIIHFGAVDYRCKVAVNGIPVGGHEGGNTSFSMDITHTLRWETEHILVEAWDPVKDETIPRGKQYWGEKPEFIWYTPSTGIWQPVWLEAVEENSLESVTYTPDIDSGFVHIHYSLRDTGCLPCIIAWKISLREDWEISGELVCREREVYHSVDVFRNHILNSGFHGYGLCWYPESPTLFDVEITVMAEGICHDLVHSYFGMRKVHVEDGAFYLNNRPYFQKLILDQGYWKDSLMTAPDDEAFREDIRLAKEMGFNGCRKHEKAEAPRFLYWADRMGFLVWESNASFISYTEQASVRYLEEWCELIRRDRNHPSIVVWNILNESWGLPQIRYNRKQQEYAEALYHMAHSLDASRPVVVNDGWELTKTDICAIHSYYYFGEEDEEKRRQFEKSLCSPEEFHKIMHHVPFAKGYGYGKEPVMLTEFGGIALDAAKEEWGYRTVQDEEELLKAYERLIGGIKQSDIIKGFCYTQLTDVEHEVNGLLKADRTPKVDMCKLLQINEQIKTVFL